MKNGIKSHLIASLLVTNIKNPIVLARSGEGTKCTIYTPVNVLTIFITNGFPCNGVDWIGGPGLPFLKHTVLSIEMKKEIKVNFDSDHFRLFEPYFSPRF